MNVLWIIGNGFDLNLGLKTGYKDFYNNDYSLRDDEVIINQRKKLEEIGASLPDDIELWSDLERFLGISAEHFSSEEEDFFHDAFENIESCLVDYLKKEQERCDFESLSNEQVDEFWRSITSFWKELPEINRAQFCEVANFHSSIFYNCISLNYTNCFDRYLEKTKERYKPFARRNIGRGYVDDFKQVLHIHGELSEDPEIVLGVSNERQLKSGNFSDQKAAYELWVKNLKNEFYGNIKTERVKSLIDTADVICFYGVSFGITDKYIWNMIGERIKNSRIQIFIFDYGLPERSGLRSRSHQKARDAAIEKFRIACDLSEEELEEFRGNLFVHQSSAIFRIKLML